MKYPALLLTSLLLTLSIPAFAAGTASTPGGIPEVFRPEEPLFASPTRVDRIGRIVAPVFINGKGPFRLVVDTGASHTTFSPALAQTLGLRPTHDSSVELNGVTGVEL